jgi:hypothetical protein
MIKRYEWIIPTLAKVLKRADSWDSDTLEFYDSMLDELLVTREGMDRNDPRVKAADEALLALQEGIRARFNFDVQAALSEMV